VLACVTTDGCVPTRAHSPGMVPADALAVYKVHRRACPAHRRTCLAYRQTCPAHERACPFHRRACPFHRRACPAQRRACPVNPAAAKATVHVLVCAPRTHDALKCKARIHACFSWPSPHTHVLQVLCPPSAAALNLHSCPFASISRCVGCPDLTCICTQPREGGICL